MQIHVSFIAEKISTIFGQPVTNSLLTGVILGILMIVGFTFLAFKLNQMKPGKIEVVLESLYLILYGLVKDILGEAKANKFFSFLFSFFIIILVSNWFGLLPIVPSVGIVHSKETKTEITSEESTNIKQEEHSAETEEVKSETNHDLGCLLIGKCYLTTQGIVSDVEFTPILRAPTADLSNTIALALISVIITNIVGLKYNGIGFLKRYFDFRGPIEFIVGIFEGISEFAKVLSFSFRLFGNVFAGEVILTVITGLTFGILTFPFFGLEIAVGLIQAIVFFMLTAIFIGLAAEHH